ncbi:MAG: glycine--tRNA ligase subunit beta [Gammaproteobacteria bacterium]|nr:MAG: glycine--tRNA ligase subunit beta [Gammaproteobacteria bacterium]
MNAADLLLEIGTEELPPGALRRLSEALAEALAAGLARAHLEHAGAAPYASPRRLAVLVRGVARAQPDREELRRGPALAVAFDDEGCPTRAAEGFARSCGVAVEDLERLETEKGAWLAYRRLVPGRPAAEVVPEVVREALDRLPVPRRMRWGDRDVEFVRPVHWVVLLHGEDVIECEILGCRTGRETRGHRFHHPDPILLAEPAVYLPVLETEGRVLADLDARREAIRGQVLEAARQVGGEARIDAALLEEVTALVEWPVAIAGDFEPRFLEVPPEVLISTMQDHQRYFPVVDAAGHLLPHFVTVANIESRDPAQVKAGNERVIRPRFEDAAFFWEQDRSRPLADRMEGLARMVFQDRLGTLLDKARRLGVLAARIGEALGGEPAWAERAALLCKCDLLTQMVYEFPELQGVMGRYYALHDGEPEEVAWAIEEHYLPRHAGDRLPETPTGQALALADRLDTLVGIFAIGQPPTGEKDPFALRRAALGLLRILVERERDLDLEVWLNAAAQQFPESLGAPRVVGAVFDFVLERLRGYCQEQGFRTEVFEAVRAVRPTRPLDFMRRVRAVTAFEQLPEAEALAAANKRIGNLLRKAREGGESVPEEVDPSRLAEPAEQALAAAIAEAESAVDPLFEAGAYESALRRLAALREPVDRFFDAVMVLAEEPGLRRNRLALLAKLQQLFLGVADLGKLQG